MHERSLVSQLIKQVMEIAADHGPGRVLVVQLQVGEFSGVDAALLRNAYDDLVVDTPLRSTALHLLEVPLVAQCSKCETEFAVQSFASSVRHVCRRRWRLSAARSWCSNQ